MEAANQLQETSTLVQGSKEWFQAKLGYFSSSGVGALMTNARGRDKEFSDTALSYIYKVAAERNLKEKYRNDYLSDYLKRVSVSSKAMEYGKEQEDIARQIYMMKTGNNVVQCGFITHPTIAYLGDSPDGVILDKNETQVIGTLEIKCPMPDTFLKYKTALKSGISLKELKAEYYWQCVVHMMCNNVEWCDFVVLDIMQNKGFHKVIIKKNEADCEQLKIAVEKANEFINKYILN